MAPPSGTALRAFVLVLVLAYVGCSMCSLLKGSVSCLDCDSRNNLSGITVAIRCKHDTKQVITLTDDNGCFEAKIPSDIPPNCVAKLLGGPKQLCSYKQFMMTRAITEKGTKSNYTFSTPLIFFSSCPTSKSMHPKGESKEKGKEFGSSKTIDLHLPREWGLAPPSYYVPIMPIPMPIIGIP